MELLTTTEWSVFCLQGPPFCYRKAAVNIPNSLAFSKVNRYRNPSITLFTMEQNLE